MSLETASDDVKLAVDLIELLETNHIPKDVAISALQLVLTDLHKRADIDDGDSDILAKGKL